MKFSRSPLLALVLTVILAGTGEARAPCWSSPTALVPAVFVGAPRQSLPVPAHNEATCAFCQAVAFTPYAPRAAVRLPERLSVTSPDHLSSDDRLTHSESSSPPRSRAPPLLRAV